MQETYSGQDLDGIEACSEPCGSRVTYLRNLHIQQRRIPSPSILADHAHSPTLVYKCHIDSLAIPNTERTILYEFSVQI